ncbi:PilN domain-containing protein [Patescibacteria group bacterium]|nr:PilN domain-containing protein [Patescibacteria group bacterium]
MISLNLLSPDKKIQVSKQMIFISLQTVISWMLVIVCVAGMILLVTKLIMQNSFNQAVGQGALVTKEYGALNQEVYLANKKVSFLGSVQKSFVVWSSKLTILTKLVPKNIELFSININHATGDIQITGYAKTRDDLLLYESQLKQSELLENVNLPIGNLLEAKEIDFKLTAKLTK